MKNQILNLHSRMNFGKYHGETIGQVADENPSYIEWMIENIDNIAFSEDVVSELDLPDDLLEINAEKLERFIDNSLYGKFQRNHYDEQDRIDSKEENWYAMTDGQYDDMPDGFDGGYSFLGY